MKINVYFRRLSGESNAILNMYLPNQLCWFRAIQNRFAWPKNKQTKTARSQRSEKCFQGQRSHFHFAVE